MDKLVKHAIRMLEIVEGENYFFRNDAKRQADIARAVYDTILRVQILERKFDKDINVRSKGEPHIVGKHADAIIIDDSRLTAKCLNCANGGSYKCSKCDGEMYYKYDKDEPKICDTCRYYNSDIPCGSTPSACKEADKFAEEFVDGLKKLKSKDEPQRDCFLCKWLGEVDVCGRCRNRNLFAEADTEPKPKDEPQTDLLVKTPRKSRESHEKTKDEPQTDCPWK